MARRGENIYHRKDGRWEARYIAGRDAQGKAKYKSIYASTYKEARKKKQDALQLLSELEEERRAQAGTVAALSEAWVRDNAYRWKESTKCRYQEKLNAYILPQFGKRSFSDISTEEVAAFIAKVQSEGVHGRNPLGSSATSMILSILKRMRAYALSTGCKVCFSTESILVKQHKAPTPVLSEKEEKALVSRLKQDMNLTGAGILLSLFTGLRIGELCALRWDAIDLEENVLHVKQTMQRLPNPGNLDGAKTYIKIGLPKSESSIRDIPLSQELAGLLQGFRKPGAYLLTGEEDRFVEPRTMENRFAKILQECGLERVNYHSTRHTFATRCIERGMDPKSLSEILGHASVSTTMNRYVHLSMKHKAQGMELLSDLIAV